MSTQKILVGALVAQVLLGVITWMPRSGSAPEPTPLIPGGGNAITALEITGKGEDAEPVRLVSDKGVWKVESAHGHPADPDKVGEVLDALGRIQLRTPIATRATSHEALGVTDNGFEKKVKVTTDAGELTVLVGSAASKAIHLRKAGEDEVHVVRGLSAWTLKDTARSYLPTNFIELEKGDLTALSITNARGTIELTKSGDGWQLGGPVPGPADAEAVGKLLDAVSRVRLSEVVGTEPLPEHGLGDDAVHVTWSITEGDTSVSGGFRIGAEDGSNRYVKRDDAPFVVRAPGYRLKDLVEADPAALAAATVAAVGTDGPAFP